MRVIYFGTPAFAVPTLRTLSGAGHRVLAAVTQPDRPVGRSKVPEPPPVKREAEEMGLPVLQPETIRTEEFLRDVSGRGAEVFVVVAYGKIFPKALLHAAPHGSINLHASLLPRWRGAAPIQWAIASGDRETGVTTMRMDEACDTGPILLQETVPIGEGETAMELSERLARAGAALMVETLRRVELGTCEERPQPPAGAGATRAPILHTEDGDADWEMTSSSLYDRWRGFQPWPGLFTRLGGKRLVLVRVGVLREKPPGLEDRQAGALWSPGAGRLAVRCGAETDLEVFEVRPEGRKTLSSAEALNGRILAAGMRFDRREVARPRSGAAE